MPVQSPGVGSLVSGLKAINSDEFLDVTTD